MRSWRVHFDPYPNWDRTHGKDSVYEMFEYSLGIATCFDPLRLRSYPGLSGLLRPLRLRRAPHAWDRVGREYTINKSEDKGVHITHESRTLASVGPSRSATGAGRAKLRHDESKFGRLGERR